MAFLDETGLTTLVGHIKSEIAAVVSEKSYFEGDLTVEGSLTVGDNLVVGGREYGANKVLWSGEMFPTGSQTLTLSEAVSAQPNGIVLSFSYYNGSSSENSNWVHVTVLKKFVLAHEGNGTLVDMRGLTGGNRASKYLYISDTSITGHDSNAAEGMTSDGAVYYNHRYALRYVIGF